MSDENDKREEGKLISLEGFRGKDPEPTDIEKHLLELLKQARAGNIQFAILMVQFQGIANNARVIRCGTCNPLELVGLVNLGRKSVENGIV